MEPSDAGGTRLKEQRRRRRGGMEEVEPSALTQRGEAKAGNKGRGGGRRERESERGGRPDFKAERARNSRLGCGVSVSRTDHFCTRENPFVSTQ